MDLMALLIAAIFFGVLYWALVKVAAIFEFPPKLVALAQVILVVLGVIWLVQLLRSGVTWSLP